MPPDYALLATLATMARNIVFKSLFVTPFDVSLKNVSYYKIDLTALSRTQCSLDLNRGQIIAKLRGNDYLIYINASGSSRASLKLG